MGGTYSNGDAGMLYIVCVFVGLDSTAEVTIEMQTRARSLAAASPYACEGDSDVVDVDIGDDVEREGLLTSSSS